MTRTRLVRGAAALLLSAGTTALGGAAWRTAHAPLEGALERALAARLPRQAVHVGRARLALPCTLVVDELAIGPLAIAHARLDAAPGSLLRGRPRFASASARGLAFAGVGRADSVEVTALGGRLHVAMRELGAAALPLKIGAVAVEILRSGGLRFERAAASGITVLGMGGLAGRATAHDGGLAFHLAGDGVRVDGTLDGRALSAVAHLDALPLAPLPAEGPHPVDLGRASATGELGIEHRAGELRVRGRVRLDDVILDESAVATRRLGPLALDLDGELAMRGRTVRTDDLHVALGPLALRVSGYEDGLGQAELKVRLLPIDCAEALRALPRDLVPTLDGLTLDGRLAGRVRLAGDLSALAELELETALDVGCRVVDDPPLADAHALTRALPRELVDRMLALAPERPPFRPLATLPPRLVHAVVESEDSRFYQHHGFDLDMIRHALAQDLSSRRFERGASTITQQLVKNLFLSGERTAARKLEEAVLAWRLEQIVPKRRILELYLNYAELGPGIYGVAEASERYFGKEPEELSVDESAQLAALLPAPRRGMDAAWERRYRALVARLPRRARPALAQAPRSTSPLVER